MQEKVELLSFAERLPSSPRRIHCKKQPLRKYWNPRFSITPKHAIWGPSLDSILLNSRYWGSLGIPSSSVHGTCMLNSVIDVNHTRGPQLKSWSIDGQLWAADAIETDEAFVVIEALALRLLQDASDYAELNCMYHSFDGHIYKWSLRRKR